MSTKAQAILDEIRALPASDQRALLQELEQRIRQMPAPPSREVYGEPLTDEDIGQSARVTFQMLDEREKRAGAR
jgi:MoxR-like ATPase